MDPRRTERVSEALREELDEIIAYEMSDPRVRVAGVADVLVSPDARLARIRLLLEGDEPARKQTIAALTAARGFLRRELSLRIDIFRIPELQFEAALDAELEARMPHLLKRVRRGRVKPDES